MSKFMPVAESGVEEVGVTDRVGWNWSAAHPVTGGATEVADFQFGSVRSGWPLERRRPGCCQESTCTVVVNWEAEQSLGFVKKATGESPLSSICAGSP